MAGFVLPGSNPGFQGTGPPPPASLPTTTVEIDVSCRDLADQDVLSKSDPMCVLFEQSGSDWIEIGRTEVLNNTLNPKWDMKFTLDYRFEERQLLKFEVYDVDDSSQKLKNHDFLGRIECPLASIITAQNKQFISMMKGGPAGSKGKFVAIAEELGDSKDLLQIQFKAKDLDKKDFFGKSDPYLVFSKYAGSGELITIRKTEFIRNTLKPEWNVLNIPIREIGDVKRKLRIEVYDWDEDTEDDLIGGFDTTLEKLQLANVEKTALPCINSKKQQKKPKYKDSGNVYVQSYKTEKQLTFMDYLQGGTILNFSVAVDFTGSNGHPDDPRSLHYRASPNHDNQYTSAIKAIGGVIQDYDTDKQFPALGFGAKVPPSWEVSHEFFLNLSENPFCSGVDGILNAYHTSVNSVQLYGPTLFAPIIRHVTKFAEHYQDGKQYFVLLILTDGIITDFEDTLDVIVNASSLPMSIIIVGVGDEDFSAMEALDGDNGMLKSRGRLAARDIVQFVEIRKYLNGPRGAFNQAALNKDVLGEVPRQLVSWMTKRGIKPLNF